MDIQELWQLTMGEMEVQLSRANYITWLKDSRLVDKKDGTLYVALPNPFTKEWVQDKYHKNILGIVRNFDPGVKKIEFVVHKDAELIEPQKITARDFGKFENRIDLNSKIDPDTNLNSRYTFDSFIVGTSNDLAYAAACGIVNEVGTKYNPVFIYGGVGLGKTHLIQAIGNAIKTKYKNKIQPRYVSSEKFTNDVIAGIAHKRMEDIKRKYRTCDVLIIDDIQFIGGKRTTEEEFFNTFNALYENNKQIIVSSDRPPQSLTTLTERLNSRFQSGMVAEVGQPDYEMRVAIIRQKLQDKNRSLGEDVVDCIARQVKKNVREIEGVVNKIIFYQETKNAQLSPKEVSEIIKTSIKDVAQRVSDDDILKAVAEYFNITVAEMTGRTRKKEIVAPRQIAIYLIREILDMSFPYIGEKLGRDHTTAMHAVSKIEQEINKNSSLNQQINLIKELIYKV